jgi:Na+-transporting NADH:ubiquinone oxidoreductase subunit NqrE
MSADLLAFSVIAHTAERRCAIFIRIKTKIAHRTDCTPNRLQSVTSAMTWLYAITIVIAIKQEKMYNKYHEEVVINNI